MTPADLRCGECGTAISHKRCSHCLQELPIVQFPRRSDTGRTKSVCRACRAIDQRIRRTKKKPDPLLLYTEKEVGVYRGGTWRPRPGAA